MFVIIVNVSIKFFYRFLSKKLMQLLKSICYESFCSSLVQDISWDELKIAEKVKKKFLNKYLKNYLSKIYLSI